MKIAKFDVMLDGNDRSWTQRILLRKRSVWTFCFVLRLRYLDYVYKDGTRANRTKARIAFVEKICES